MWIRINTISLIILPQIPWKSHVSTIFFSQKSSFSYSLCILPVIVNIVKMSRARLDMTS